jgi:hypothetical protein
MARRRLSPRTIHRRMMDEHRQLALQHQTAVLAESSAVKLARKSSSSMRSSRGTARLSSSAAHALCLERQAYLNPEPSFSDPNLLAISGAWTDRSHNRPHPMTAPGRVTQQSARCSVVTRPHSHQSRRMMDWEVKVNVRRETGSYCWWSSGTKSALSPRIVFGDQARPATGVLAGRERWRILDRGAADKLPNVQIALTETELPPVSFQSESSEAGRAAWEVEGPALVSEKGVAEDRFPGPTDHQIDTPGDRSPQSHGSENARTASSVSPEHGGLNANFADCKEKAKV